MRRRAASSAWCVAELASHGTGVEGCSRVARALQGWEGSRASRSVSTSSAVWDSKPRSFDWDDDAKVLSLRAGVREALVKSRASTGIEFRLNPGPHAESTVVTLLGWWRQPLDPPPWETRKTNEVNGVHGLNGNLNSSLPAYDPQVLTAYFAKRPWLLVSRFTEIMARALDIGIRVSLKRGTVEERARRLKNHFARLGPAFIKLGQVLSTRSDFLPEAYRTELSELQENIEPASKTHALELLLKELKLDSMDQIDSLFKDGFPALPVAAASLAQVYKVQLNSETFSKGFTHDTTLFGDDIPSNAPVTIALKIQRPGLAANIALDAVILRGIAIFLRNVIKLRSDVVGIVDELVGRIFGELSYGDELVSVEKFRAIYSLGGTSGPELAGKVRAPRVIPELSTDSVLAMEWIDGARLTDAAGIEAIFSGINGGNKEKDDGYFGERKENEKDRNKTKDGYATKQQSRYSKQLLERGVRCSLHQLLETGFMHADPHPGNLIVDAKTGALTYLDFGMTVSVTKQRRKAMIRGLVGFVNKDAVSLVRDLVDLEFLPRDVDVRAATRALTKVFQGVGSKAAEGVPATTIRGTNDFLGVVSQLGTALFDHNFRLPPYFSRILRALASLEGVATGVDVNFRVIDAVYPYVLRSLLQDPDPETRNVLRRLILTENGHDVRWGRVLRIASAMAEAVGEQTGGDEGSKDTRETSNGCGLDFEKIASEVAATSRGVAEGAAEVARLEWARRAGRKEDDTEGTTGDSFTSHDDSNSDSPTLAAAAAVRDAMAYVYSPAGTNLRLALVKDALGASDELLRGMERREGRVEREREDKPSGEDGSSSSTTTSESRGIDFDKVCAVANTGRSVYLSAPKIWAPVLAEFASKPETLEICEQLLCGLSNRATKKNARLVLKAVLTGVGESI